jgi:hypothetical protein
MTTYLDLQSQIAEQRRTVERERLAAQQAEQQRIANENAPRLAIAQAERELRTLEAQARDIHLA